METKTINLYKFSELSKEAKEKVIEKHYENEEHPFLEDNLKEFLIAGLTERGIEFDRDDIKVLYSFSYSQGDGFCFTGKLTKNGILLKLTHNYRYYYDKSVEREFFDTETGEELDGEFNEKDIELWTDYLALCKECEKQGYDELEYRMNDEEFEEYSEDNEYMYFKSGKRSLNLNEIE